MAFSEECREKILSEEYMDIITGEYWSPGVTDDRISGFCSQSADRDVKILYLDRNTAPPLGSDAYFYQNIPSLYIPLSTSALNAAGILRAADQPALGLQGQGVILAFADTGIDYTHPDFRKEDGTPSVKVALDSTSVQTSNGQSEAAWLFSPCIAPTQPVTEKGDTVIKLSW